PAKVLFVRRRRINPVSLASSHHGCRTPTIFNNNHPDNAPSKSSRLHDAFGRLRQVEFVFVSAVWKFTMLCSLLLLKYAVSSAKDV
ncbi:hypothetical protein chiPu_0023572, partial [Chiloscyllium punctatum]|nr:hypothetical protein [Chiloscyllium punctatum]